VQRVLEHGYPSWSLCELSHDADLVVVQHRGRHGLHRLSTRSAAVTLGGHAACPAVSVPETWTGEPLDGGDWVTVGVHEKGVSPEVLAAAFAAASGRGASLRLVHAWRLDPAYDAIVVARIDPDWVERVRAEVLRAIDAEVQAHPEVKVDVQVLHQWPAEALDQLAETSSLLVVGRHATTMPWPRIGSIARAAVTRSACPVMVVPT
jgi:nucleotide-binding universal stress UspA family protein